MKQGRNLLFFAALIVLILSLSGSAFAQAETFCLGLEGEDCELYEQLQTNQELPISTGMQTSVNGEITVGEMVTEFAVDVSGAYVTDVEAFQAALDTFGAVTLRDLSLGNLVDLLNGVVSAWDAELFIDLSGIPGAEMVTGGETIDLYFVDGVAYVNGPILATLFGDPNIEGVYGIDAFEAIDFGLSSVTMADLLQLGNGMDDGMGDMDDMGGMDAFTEAFTEQFMTGLQQGMAAQDLSEEELANFVSVARLDDETVDGETVAVFETTVDIANVFTVPAIRELTVQSIQQSDPQEMMDPEAVIDGLEAGLAGSTVTVVERYSLDSTYLVGFEMNMDIMVDSTVMAEAMGMPAEDEMPFNMTIDINFMRENINAVEAITLPEGAQVVPLMELLGGGM